MGLRHRANELLHAYLPRRVGGLDLAWCGTGNGAAGGEDDDGRETVCSKSRNRQKLKAEMRLTTVELLAL